ncbi:PfkB family carbohydrate kinase [Haloferax sp. Atlit-4N]|uniref:PfkB family carbohydrate kinase n=1 Tax=Haloferax sp. Atlit-4N TaxID=2077206 RepID=UPI003744A6AB
MASNLVDEFGFETVIITRGDEGALAHHQGVTYEQPAFETDTVDAIGTGDAFVGAYLARRIEDDDVPVALAYAAATAALKLTISGDLAIVTPEEVEHVLSESTTDIAR